MAGIESVPGITNSDSIVKSKGRLSGSFGRLKAQKVKALIHKTSRMKQERSINDDNLVVEHAAIEKFGKDNSNLESFGKKKREDTHNYRERFPRAQQSHRDRDMMRIRGVEDDLETSENSDKRIARSDISVARHSDSHKKGWDNGRDNGRPMRTFKSESQKLRKEQRKPLADSDFFSRKSFKDLGYSEYMIESLAKQSFRKPSHIQVTLGFGIYC